MYGFRRGSGGAGGSGNVSTLSGGANGRITLWNGPTTVTGDPSGTWSGTGHTFVVGSPTFHASDGHFTGPAGASVGPSSVGGGFTNQPAGDTVTLVSDNAADNTQQVTIIGVLAGVDASENITLTDVTPVVSVGTYDKVLALVLNNACVGTVTASETSGGLTITTIAPAALSAGLQTFVAIDGYGKVLQIVASGATTKTVGIGGYAIGGAIQREPVVLTGTTKVNTTNTWEGAVQFYLGDLEATRTVTLNSIAGFDFSPGLISLGTQQDTFISRASAGTLLVEDGSGNARDVQARTVLGGNGTAALPTFSFSGEPSTGFYLPFSAFVSLSIFGARTYDFDTTGIRPLTPLTLGSSSYPWSTGYFGTSVVTSVLTVATLPATPTAGERAMVSNALAPAFGAPVAAGGAVTVPVFYDGAAWIVG